MSLYSWAATYSAGSDAFVYRRFKGELPEYAAPYAMDAPPHVVAFCDKHDIDVAVEDELVPGRVRKVRLDKFSDEAP